MQLDKFINPAPVLEAPVRSGVSTPEDGVLSKPSINLSRWLVAFFVLLPYLPYLFLGEHAYIRIHDTLEGELMWYHLLIEKGLLFDFSYSAVVDEMMYGIPRKFLHTGFSFVALWLSLFGTYWGYIFNLVLVHLIGFFGMFYLLEEHIIRQKQHRYIAYGVAIIFSYIPVFSIFGLTVMGQPLVMASGLSLLKGRAKWWHFAVFLIFPLYSSVVWVGPAIVGLGIGAGLYYWNKLGRFNMMYWSAIGAMTLLFLLANWQLVGTIVNPGDFVSHRLEYDYFYNKELGLIPALKEMASLFFAGHYHVGTMLTIPAFFALLYLRLYGRWEKILWKPLLVLLAVIAFSGFYGYLVYYGADFFPLLKTYKFNRVIMLMPALWMIVFAISLSRMGGRGWRWIVGSLMILQAANTLAPNDEFIHNLRALGGADNKPSFQSFVAEPLFSQIKKNLEKEGENLRVACLGFHPSIAHYNGLRTIGGHQTQYDLNYKHAFRKIIADELNKNSEIKKEFDDFGNRCYLFSSELGKNEGIAFMQSKEHQIPLNDLSLNSRALADLGADYILSATPILNAPANHLRLVDVFEDEEAFWQIRAYRIQKNHEITRKN